MRTLCTLNSEWKGEKRNKQKKEKNSPCGLPPNLVKLPNCKSGEDKAEQTKQFASRAAWERVIPQACFQKDVLFPRDYHRGVPLPTPGPFEVKAFKRLPTPARLRFLRLVCRRADWKGNDYSKESRGGGRRLDGGGSSAETRPRRCATSHRAKERQQDTSVWRRLKVWKGIKRLGREKFRCRSAAEAAGIKTQKQVGHAGLWQNCLCSVRERVSGEPSESQWKRLH